MESEASTNRDLPLKADRPYTRVVFAMSVEGISNLARSAAGFGSSTDRKHLEALVALADAFLFGTQ